jgi:phosphoribosylaminoimidazole-succinocarboxamide synthase
MGTAAIETTDFHFPGQTALYHGKVRDVYTINDLLVSVATDRISAFDVILPRPIPYKGQVLNQLAAYFLKDLEDVVPNWLEAVPDPNASVGRKADPVKIELVIRGCLVGHAWREYAAGKRELCGAPMPDGLKEYDAFPEPIITPTTKAAHGHDEDLTEAELLEQSLATPEEWEQLKQYMRQLFARGQAMAHDHGLVLADTKYEFGRLDGKLILIDEVHTPDSSRYFYADSYDAYIGGQTTDKPRHLSKEFVRQWLTDKGFSGQAGQAMPELTNEFVQSVSERYIELYEEMTGEKFAKVPSENVLQRIETNVTEYLQKGTHATN